MFDCSYFKEFKKQNKPVSQFLEMLNNQTLKKQKKNFQTSHSFTKTMS